MLSSLEILTTLRDLIDKHALWSEVEQHGGCDRAWMDGVIHQIETGQVNVRLAPKQYNLGSLVFCYPTTTLTTTQLHDLCYSAAINEYALVNGESVAPAPTAWQRNLDRHYVKYELNPDCTQIVGVKLVLDPEEWCAAGMRGGVHYLGETDPALQQIFNTAFQAGGWMAATAVSRYGVLSRNRYGTASPCNAPELLLFHRWFSRSSPLTPWERLGGLYQLADGHLMGETTCND